LIYSWKGYRNPFPSRKLTRQKRCLRPTPSSLNLPIKACCRYVSDIFGMLLAITIMGPSRRTGQVPNYILGGYYNEVFGTLCVVIGGEYNCARPSCYGSLVGGGLFNRVSASWSTLWGGSNNTDTNPVMEYGVLSGADNPLPSNWPAGQL
jgi:hypothetical protein